MNVPSGSENNIPLTLACWKGHRDVVDLLLDNASNIEHQNKAGCTPLMLAARCVWLIVGVVYSGCGLYIGCAIYSGCTQAHFRRLLSQAVMCHTFVLLTYKKCTVMNTLLLSRVPQKCSDNYTLF